MISKKSFSDKDFTFNEILGQGGFAVVYRAKCLNNKIPDNFVAIKKIRKENFRRVKNEFIIHSRLIHPNIIKLYGKYEDQKFVYLILELCSKGSLEDYLKREGRLKEVEACKFFKQIVQGVQYLHDEKLVIHRDIALKNILLSENKTAKLADFGLSVKVNHANDARTTFSGTPFFMSPEVVMNGSHTFKRDCWSLGCVLYTLLVGKSPFDGQCPGEVFTNVIMQDVTFPDDMSREAKELISCLLEKEDSKRPGIKDILKFDFFKKHEKDLKCYRNGDSGTGSMGSSPMTSSKLSHHFNKTSDSGMDSINSGSAEFKRNSENTRKNRCLDTIHSSESIGMDERSSISRNSNRESSRESRSRPLVRNMPNMLPSYDYNHYSENVDEKFDNTSSFRSLSMIKSATRKDDYKRSESKEKYQNGPLKSHPRHYSSEREPESYQRFPSSPYGSGHIVKSRSCNPASENKICHDPNCKFEKPLSVEGNRKEYLPSGSHSNVCKSENTACSHEHSYHCFEKVTSFTSQLVKTTNKSTESCKTKSLSDVTEPLNTKRLSPMRKMLRQAKVVISISKEGRVFVEHFKKNKIVSLIFEISPDGKAISRYEPKEKCKISNKPLSRRNCLFKIYSFENFPEEYFKFYVWAKKVVDIARAKTAKVTVYGREWKCDMMENGPYPDFNMEFYNGAMVKKTSKEVSYIDENGIDHLLFSGGEVNKKYENIWKDFLMVQEQCEIYEEHNKSLEESGMVPFPARFGSSDDFASNCKKWREELDSISSFRSPSKIKSATRKDDHKQSASKEKYQNSPNERHPENVLSIENNKENLRSQSSLSFPKNDENWTLPNTHTSASNYNHVPLEKNNCLTRSIDEILEKLNRKPEVVKGEIIAEYFDGFQLRCSKDGTDFSFFDPCNRKIKSLNPTLKRRLQQDLLGILVYIGEEDEKRRQT